MRRRGLALALALVATGCVAPSRSATVKSTATDDARAADAAACDEYAADASRPNAGQAARDSHGIGAWIINPATGAPSWVGAVIHAGTFMAQFTARTIADYRRRPAAADAYRSCMSARGHEPE